MTQQLKQLPPKNRYLITLAACIGHQFELSLLATVAEQKQEEVRKNIFTSLQQKLLLQKGDYYYFSHDRIQEAALPFTLKDTKGDFASNHWHLTV